MKRISKKNKGAEHKVQVIKAQGYPLQSEVKCVKGTFSEHEKSIFMQWKVGSYDIVNSLSVFVYTKYTEFENQSKFGGGLEQTSIFLNSKKWCPREQIALQL